MARLDTPDKIDQRMAEIAEDVAELKAEMVRLTDGKTKFLEQTPEQMLAITLHDTLCRHNHTDGCGWHYELDDDKHMWTRSTHRHWHANATQMIRLCLAENITTDVALKVISFARKM